MSASLKNAEMLSFLGIGFASEDDAAEKYEGSLHREAGDSRARSTTEVSCLLSLLPPLFAPQATISPHQGHHFFFKYKSFSLYSPSLSVLFSSVS